MTLFAYHAARPDGERLRGQVEAPNRPAAAALLSERGLLPLSLSDRPEHVGPPSAPPAELAAMLGGLAALLQAGLPADRALACVTSGSSAWHDSARQAMGRVREGESLSAALAAIGGFPEIVLGMLRAGEAQGRLADAAARAAAELERDAELKARFRAALTYPTFLLVAGTLSVVVILGFVVPRFAVLLGDLGQALPFSTRVIVSLSSAARDHAVLLAALTAVAAVLARSAMRAPAFKVLVHRRLLQLPVVGPLRSSLATSRIARTLSALLDSGVPVVRALVLAEHTVTDCEISRRIVEARRDVTEGSRLPAALGRHGALTPRALELVRFGDESGRSAEFMTRAAQLEEVAAQRTLEQLVAVIEPALIVMFGAVVAFVAAALLQAVYALRPSGL